MTHLTIGSETLNVSIEGDPQKPALMLSNSLGTDLSMWDGQMAALTRNFRIIRYDPRGHGGSGSNDRPRSIGDLGRDALAILDSLNIEKAHWLGLSMGGAVGLWLLVNAPERIDRAVLANTAAVLGTPEAWNTRITKVLAGGTADNAAATIERWFSPAFSTREPSRVEAVHAMLRAAPPEGYAATCAALRDMDLRSALSMITNEVLIVTGDDDPVIPAEDAAALVSGISGAAHVALPAKHMSNIEAESAFNAAILAFLTRPVRRQNSPRKSRRPSRQATQAAPPPVKQAGASRRSNPARNPLKTAAKKRAVKRASTSARRSPAKASEPHRRPVAKRAGARPAAKAAPKKRATKITQKAASARRQTSTAAAREPVKKAKPAKRTGAAKVPTKKTPAKTTAKKLPTPRRKPAKKPRRPTGRRKS